MVKGENIMEDEIRVHRAAGDYICSVCGTKVIGGDHDKADCRRIADLKKGLEAHGHQIIVMA